MEQAPELVALLERYYAASGRSDADFLEQLIDHHPGALVVGTAPPEWWPGDEAWGTWAAAWRRRGGMPVRAGAPQAWREGSVGWAADQAAWQLPGGGELPFRLTAVFRQEGGEWKLVQAHFSLGVPDERAAELLRGA